MTDGNSGGGDDPRALLEANIGLVHRILEALVRSKRLPPDEAAEFTSWVHEKLVDDDYRILRRYAGPGSLRAYLTVTIRRLLEDFRRAQWGHWRPQAAARRGGWTTELYERLTHRDGLSDEEARRVLTERLGRALSNDDARSLDELPRRAPRTIEASDVVDGLCDRGPDPEARLLADEEDRQRRRRNDALAAARARLSPRERLLVRLRYDEGVKVVDVARTVGEEPRRMYRRLERVKGKLRRWVEAELKSENDGKGGP